VARREEVTRSSAILFALVLGACSSAAGWSSPASTAAAEAPEAPAAHATPAVPAAPVEPAAPATAASILLPSDDHPGLSNFAKVDDGLYRGAQPTSAGMEVLQSLGVKTIVNLRALHSDRDEIQGLGFRYAHISCKAWHAEEEDVVRFLAIATDPANRPVFLHCEHGADRTGMMIAAYRVMVQGWTSDAAAAELPRFGFHTIWTGIRERVLRFDAEHLRSRVASARRETLEIVP
jgi:tyrosine-protein phosphatase SIW14